MVFNTCSENSSALKAGGHAGTTRNNDQGLAELNFSDRDKSPNNMMEPLDLIASHGKSNNAELLASIERKDNSLSLLSELNAHGVSPRRTTKKTNQFLKLSNIRSVDEGEESPMARHKVLNKFAASINSSIDSKNSELFAAKKGVSSHMLMGNN